MSFFCRDKKNVFFYFISQFQKFSPIKSNLAPEPIPLTLKEQEQLTNAINEISEDKLLGVINIIKEHQANLANPSDSDEVCFFCYFIEHCFFSSSKNAHFFK